MEKRQEKKTIEFYQDFYNHLVPDCDTKNEMDALLKMPVSELRIRIDELERFMESRPTSSNYNTRKNIRVGKMIWAIHYNQSPNNK